MGTKHDTGCYQHALDDEPIFTLSARDPAMAETIRYWITLREAMIGRGEKPMEDHAKLEEAARTAQDAVIWRSDATDPSTYPDTPRWRLPVAGKPDPLAAMLTLHSEVMASVMGDKADASPETLLLEHLYGMHDTDPVMLKVGTIRAAFASIAERMTTIIEDRDELLGAQLTPGVVMAEPVSIPYDDWIEWHKNAMPLGNRFLLNTWSGKLHFSVHEGPKSDTAIKWSSLYPLTKSLQADMLRAAFLDWKAGRQHKVDTLKSLLPTDRAGRVVALRDITDNMRSKIVDYSDKTVGASEETHFLLEAFEQYADQIDKVRLETPFIAVDLAARLSVKLRETAKTYRGVVRGTTWPNRRKDQMLEYADRMDGYARELEEGSIVGKSLQTKRVRAFGIPDFDPPLSVADAIETIGSTTGTVFDGKTLRPIQREDIAHPSVVVTPKPRPIGMSPALGMPYGDARVEEAPQIDGEELRRVMEEPVEWSGYAETSWDSTRYRKPSDTADVTATPDLPPHRFTMFTKAQGWAYGRGLEINPAHIPDMLDRMEADGWLLAGFIGEPSAAKVGMIFRRAPPPRSMETPWVLLGTHNDYGIYVPVKMPETDRACLRTNLSTPCGAAGLGRGTDA